MLDRRTLICGTMAVAALAAVGAAPALAADQALIDAATKEGSVNWYTSLIQDQAARPLARAFEEKYPGISVEIIAGKSADLLLKINDELAAGRLHADVHHGGSVVPKLLAMDAIQPYVPPSAANLPDDMKDPDGYWVAEVVSFLVPAYNTDMVPAEEAPKTYEDLLDPKWKGAIAWAATMTQGGPPGFIGTVLGLMGQEKGMEYLRKLSEQNIVNVPANQRVTLDQVIAGEYPLALSTFSHHTDISQEDGAPVQWIALQPKVTNTIDSTFLMKGAPHPNAGKLFIDFIVSDAGQKVLADAGYIPANPKFRNPERSPEAFALTPSLVAAHLNDWVAIYDELFK
ncbi:ABC transporter substrate-binding protein [Acuticoccus mangrovi]|uniref:Extracellular solute-binding protein n=1 Tax=Acuticoccus mangrovi TaxID=2796142 RepID=A0A934IRU1_9HYPH|nr:extracellular solute-binding protein [Acuticoccus mangrovi]MBJ3777082.1 extracellular solute-binding protein [Acuticoccus mangrovi]